MARHDQLTDYPWTSFFLCRPLHPYLCEREGRLLTKVFLIFTHPVRNPDNTFTNPRNKRPPTHPSNLFVGALVDPTYICRLTMTF